MKVFYKNTEISDNLNYVKVNTGSTEIVNGTKFAYSTFETLPEAYEEYVLSQTDWSNMFQECRNLTSLDVSNWNSSNVTKMFSTFQGCSSLNNLDVSHWNTSAVTNMGYMFHSCNSLTSLDLSNWDTSNVTNMNRMFYGCTSLTSLDVSNFNTSKVTDMGTMFTYCSSLTSLDLSHFNTSAVTQLDGFVSNAQITSFTATDWNLQSCVRPSGIFLNCQNLVNVNISGWTFGSVLQTYYGIFENCPKLETVDLSGWVFPATQPMGIFRSDTNLKTITLKGCSETFIDYIKSEITQSGLSLDNITLITE